MDVFDAILELLSHPLPMLVYGMACNLLFMLAEESKQNGEPVDWREVLGRRRYRTPLGIIASLAGALILYKTGQLSALSAFGVGYMGTDVLDRLGQAAGNRFTR